MPRSSRPLRLLERATEVARIEAGLAGARAGRGSVIVVEGVAGIGKSSLLARAEELAAGRSCLVLRGGHELEHDLSWGVVRELFTRHLLQVSPRERALVLSGAAGLALGPLRLGGDAPGVADDGLDVSAALHGLYWLCSNLAERQTLLIAVDDAHVADGPSARWLAYLARRVADLPVLLVVAARPTEPGGRALDGVMADTGRVLRPLPLTAGACAVLVRSVAGGSTSDDVCLACHEATAGNPFLLREVAEEIASERNGDLSGREPGVVPDVVSRTVRRRLRALGVHATSVASSVAVLGSAATPANVARHGELQLDEVAAIADDLVAADVLRHGDRLEFVHPLVRSVVYGDLAVVRRSMLHAKAARVVAESGYGSVEVAVQLLEATPSGDPWVVEQLRVAAREASLNGAPDAAVRYLERAVAEQPGAVDAALLFELGAAETVTRGPSALDHLREALRLERDAVRRGQVALALASLLIYAGEFDEARAVAEAALDEPGKDRAASLQLIALLASASLHDRRLHPVALAALSRVDPAAPVDPDGTRAEVISGLGRVAAALPGDRPGESAVLSVLAAAHLAQHASVLAAACGRKALASGSLLRELTAASPLYWCAPLSLMFVGSYDECAAIIETALDDSRARGLELGLACSYSFRSNLNFRRGRLVDAVADARVALDSERLLASHVDRCFATAFVVDALVERGELDAADGAIAASGLASSPPENYPLAMVVAAWAKVALARGRLAEGIELLSSAGPSLELSEVVVPWRGALAQALAGLGRGDEARDVAASNLEGARKSESDWWIGAALRVHGLVAGELGALEEAVEVLAPSGCRLEHARALGDLGAALRRTGLRSRAIEVLTAAVVLAEECGAERIANRAREELVVAGGRLPELDPGPNASLTPSEVRVAAMARDGMSNREIAQALFVSLRTVETHLTRTYAKLAISSRQELRAVALE